jgi:hypothetical protein
VKTAPVFQVVLPGGFGVPLGTEPPNFGVQRSVYSLWFIQTVEPIAQGRRDRHALRRAIVNWCRQYFRPVGGVQVCVVLQNVQPVGGDGQATITLLVSLSMMVSFGGGVTDWQRLKLRRPAITEDAGGGVTVGITATQSGDRPRGTVWSASAIAHELIVPPRLSQTRICSVMDEPGVTAAGTSMGTETMNPGKDKVWKVVLGVSATSISSPAPCGPNHNSAV